MIAQVELVPNFYKNPELIAMYHFIISSYNLWKKSDTAFSKEAWAVKKAL